MSKIIKPEGDELWRCLNEGYPICNECGAIMDRVDDEVYACPSCGWSVDVMDYEYESEDDEEWTEETLNMFGGDVPPEGCRACGGPYPQCMTSCKLFDD